MCYSKVNESRSIIPPLALHTVTSVHQCCNELMTETRTEWERKHGRRPSGEFQP